MTYEIGTNSCVICGTSPADLHHIKTRGAGGQDLPHNLIELCRAHHQEVHFRGLVCVASKHEKLRDELLERDWKLVDRFGVSKWKHE